MFGNSWRVGRIAGIELRIDTSWLIIAVLITYSLYLQFTSLFVALAPGAAIALALGSAGLFFGSVLGHEMAHALVARARGIPVSGITLFLFGGATHARIESRKARDEFLVSVVGPLTSLVLSGVFYALAWISRAALPAPVTGGLGYLSFVNVLLAVFNFLPGFPLDGGRVLRSAIWHFTGNFARATRIATASGQVIGYGVAAVGIGFAATGNTGEGIWLAAIGWFLAQAARSSYRDVEVRRALEGAEASDVMSRDIVSIPADVTLRQAADRFFKRFDHAVFPVVDDGETVGVVTIRAVNSIPSDEWDTTTVRTMMGDVADERTVTPTTRMDRVLPALQGREGRRVVVVRDGELVGIITPSDVARWLQRWRPTTATDES